MGDMRNTPSESACCDHDVTEVLWTDNTKMVDEQFNMNTCLDVVTLPNKQHPLDKRRRPVTDRGYAWVILAACFFLNFVSGGTYYLQGIFYLTFLDVFQCSPFNAALVCSLHAFFALATGVVMGFLVERFGSRVVCFIGGPISAAGFILCSFSTNIHHVQITYGVISGIGMSLYFQPSIVTIHQWFDQKRSLAVGIVVAGSCLGAFTYAPLTEYLLNKYAWRGTLLLIGGVTLHTMPMALLLRAPPKETQCHSNTTDATKGSSKCLCTVEHAAASREEKQQRKRPQLVDPTCLRTPLLYVVLFAVFVYELGLAAGYVFLPARAALELHCTGYQVAMLLSVMGILNGVARFGAGLIGNLNCVNRVYLYSASFMATGLINVVFVQVNQYFHLLVYSVIFGTVHGVYTSLCSSVEVDIFGVKWLAHLLGFHFLACGFGQLVGSPLGALILETTKNYSYLFGVLGTMQLLAGALFLMGFCVSKARRRNAESES